MNRRVTVAVEKAIVRSVQARSAKPCGQRNANIAARQAEDAGRQSRGAGRPGARRQARLDPVQTQRGVLGDLRRGGAAEERAEPSRRRYGEPRDVRKREQRGDGASARRSQPADALRRLRQRRYARCGDRAIVGPIVQSHALRDERDAEPARQRAVECVFADGARGEQRGVERRARPSRLRGGVGDPGGGNADLGERARLEARCAGFLRRARLRTG
ncbi:MAG: hypothetical protein V9G24_20165 [Rhodoblastus sp.]